MNFIIIVGHRHREGQGLKKCTGRLLFSPWHICMLSLKHWWRRAWRAPSASTVLITSICVARWYLSQWPFPHRDSALSPQWRLAFTPPLFVYTEPGNARIKHAAVAEPKEAGRSTSSTLRSECCFFFPRCFPRCPTVNLNMYPLTAYNHIDAVIMWLNPDSPCIVDSEKVKFLLYMTSHNHHQ